MSHQCFSEKTIYSSLRCSSAGLFLSKEAAFALFSSVNQEKFEGISVVIRLFSKAASTKTGLDFLHFQRNKRFLLCGFC